MKKWIIFILVISVSGLSFLLNGTIEKSRIATWLWDTAILEERMEEIVAFVGNEKIDIVYIQFQEEVEMEVYRNFTAVLHEKGIRVYALDGSPTWGIVDMQEEEQFYSWFEAYQSKAAPHEQFAGIHLDVEPYLLEVWETNPEWVIRSYQEMITRAFHQLQGSEVLIGVDIPFWYEQFDYNNQFGEGNFARWIIEQADEVTIMAYRNYAEGEGGIIDIVEREIDWAVELDKPIYVAVETVPLEEDYTSFYGRSLAIMEEEIAKVTAHYRTSKSYAGVAIHHLEHWMQLRAEQ